MTLRQLYEYALIEMNKLQAPSLMLEDYNYFINKATFNWINLRYNVYDLYQQSTDDLQVLKGTVELTPTIVTNSGISLFSALYEGDLPKDYYHLLNCICQFDVKKDFKCYEEDSQFYQGATRLTSDMYSQIINNHYMRPSYRRPYYYIHNSTEPTLDTNPTPGKVPEVATGDRYGISTDSKIQIRYGRDDSVFKLDKILIDYIRVPRHMRLTQEQIDMTIDTSQVMEFPDYVCYEIVKELVKLLMENASDPRLQTNIPVNQTISPPPQMQQEDGK